MMALNDRDPHWAWEFCGSIALCVLMFVIFFLILGV